MTQLIITMRREFAKRFAKDRSLLDVSRLFAPFRTVALLGAPGYSMRVTVDDAEALVLERELESDFIVERDYVMQLLTNHEPPPRRAARKAAGTQGR